MKFARRLLATLPTMRVTMRRHPYVHILEVNGNSEFKIFSIALLAFKGTE
ncbi:Hypothetical predicted protein [Podarcis lilfordi]|uniref:Uncharacterized protein n=1 Tax=Podarcis lilfordi TaxID=74358 RepID=A0AA35JVF6_9SAUR|nr:Hypothetical predicted protein [Podarcis lilfordi]